MLFSVMSGDTSEATDAETQKVLVYTCLFFFSLLLVRVSVTAMFSPFFFWECWTWTWQLSKFYYSFLRDLMWRSLQMNYHLWVAAVRISALITANHVHLKMSLRFLSLRLRGACRCILLCVRRCCPFLVVSQFSFSKYNLFSSLDWKFISWFFMTIETLSLSANICHL